MKRVLGEFPIMRISDYINNLDDLSTPVMILDSAGKVIYKNEAAVRCVRLPKRNTHIFIHLDKTGLSEYEKIQKRHKPSIITVNTGDKNARAFVSKYLRDGESCSLWVFVQHLQANASSMAFNSIENGIISASYQICEAVADIDRLSFSKVSTGRKTVETRLSKRLATILERIYSLENAFDYSGMYSSSKAAEILSISARRIFTHYGYELSLSTEKSEDYYERLVDYRGFSSLFTHLLLFAVSANHGRGANAKFILDSECLRIEMMLSMPISPIYISGEKNVSRLSQLCPKNMVDVIVLERLCSVYGYSLEFSVLERAFDNVSIVATVPLKDTGKLRTDAFDIEYLLLEKDQTVLYAFLLSSL